MAWHHASTVIFRTRLCRHVQVTRLCTCSVLLVFALGGPGFKCHEANQTITELYLHGNKIGSDGAVALAEALKAWLVMCFCYLVRVTCYILLSGTEPGNRRTRSFQAQESSNLLRDMLSHRGR